MTEAPPILGLHPETAKFMLSVLATIGVFIAFLAGLVQYRSAQLWRRKEFIGREIKSFLDDKVVKTALLLIDWSTRHIAFDPLVPRDKWQRITRQDQVAALEPHLSRPIPPEKVNDPDFHRYSDVEASIRDSYDMFLDGLERLSAFSDAGLFREYEVLPYLGYWIQDLSSVGGSVEDQRWRLSLLAYIQFYRFSGVQRLFQRLGKDITMNGAVWKSLSQADPQLARKLESVCKTPNTGLNRTDTALSRSPTG
jgi:hypothetical protein